MFIHYSPEELPAMTLLATGLCLVPRRRQFQEDVSAVSPDT